MEAYILIVQCIDIYNENTNIYSQQATDTFVTKGWHYNVLEISFDGQDVRYRVMSDCNGTYHFPILVRAQDFKVVSPRIPNNWILHNRDDNSSLLVSPAKWVQHELWEYTFWQEYDNATPRTLQCYREELIEILRSDKEYIQIMLDERNGYPLQSWHETVPTLFNEVLRQN